MGRRPPRRDYFPPVFLAINTTHFEILPFSYKSEDLAFSDWITLFTLCLAPLIAHILSGAPKVVYFAKRRPSWHERIGVYNPTTILWRYFAIADRRIRAKHWSAVDVAAANVNFWTSRGWDGSEALSRNSREYCVSRADSKHARLLSVGALETLIVTLQGVNALYTLTSSIVPSQYWNSANFSNTLSIGTIFFPLSVFGLLRLFAAFWLTDDSIYTNYEDFQTMQMSQDRESLQDGVQLLEIPELSTSRLPENSDATSENDYHAPNCWQSLLFRVSFLVPIVGLIVICLYYTVPTSIDDNVSLETVTGFILVLFYLIIFVVTLFIYGYYFFRDQNITTVIPCISALWYQIYTGILIGMVVVLIIVASLETRQSQCGYFTSWPSDTGTVTHRSISGIG
ncbi:uncharacterized protein LY89DRAFT_750591 [Mollisia scopiformis]|uniref:Uncharacterized protein n=1 Tax=Mollisia scopiformis TaxID=149040 RepID=A0A194X507_MOLSC|nr:uncharacterized protein LY89DRAFT_750591 [Mollisia scopiformis]KUJ15266.1 hypothetical protein LY89DRAFT_750591 [Mollisia scopiformis]